MAQRILLKRCLRRNSISIVGRGGGGPSSSLSLSSSIAKSTTIPTSSSSAVATSKNDNRHFTSIASTSSSSTFIPLNLNKNEATSLTSSTSTPGINKVSPIAQNQRQLQLLQYRNKSFQSTNVLYSDEKTAPSSDETKDKIDAEDDVPVYQNPLHHDDPNKNKIFLEDFKEGETPEAAPLPPFDDGSGKVVAAPHLHDLADQILLMSMYEMKELVDRVQDHFGLEDDGGDYMVEGGDGSDGGEEEAKVEEKTAFDLKLTGFDAKSKIKVIKEVRAITGLGLKEAKEMVEGAPKVVKKDIKKEEAEELKEKLEAVGATVDIE